MTLRSLFGVAGIVLLGAALAWAPIAAFHDEMGPVTKLGLAGVACLAISRLLPRPPAPPEDPASKP